MPMLDMVSYSCQSGCIIYRNIFFTAPDGFFGSSKLSLNPTTNKLYVSLEDYYRLLDIKADNKRSRTLTDFLNARNLSIEDHQVKKKNINIQG